MNILIVVDKYQSAIHRLAISVEKLNPHFNIKILPIHPKRSSTEALFEAQDSMRWADLIDIHYWKSGEVLRQTFPTDFESKPKIVCHFNPYDYDKLEWPKIYDAVTVGNESIHSHIPYATLIPYCIDLNFWKFNLDEYTQEKIVNMCVARIEGKKGVLEVARACRELEYKLVVVGRVSDQDYMAAVMEAGKGFIEFRENLSDEDLRKTYYESAVHVCNSVDNFESGTLPILEAMACGVPVLTRNIGHVPDLNDGTNMVVRDGGQEDIEELKQKLSELVENRDWRLKIRDNAWQTVKNRPEEKMARMYSSLYYKVLGKKDPLVSIIIPTKDRPDVLIESLAHAVQQDYSNKEVIVVDSGDSKAELVIKRFREQTKVPIKYLWFENKGEYTLPKARNLGVMESEGEVLVFCDDRLAMNKDAVTNFMKNIQLKKWLWGMKDDVSKGFVENFSAVRRDDLISCGGFNERIDCYGGATQDIRERFEKRLGFAFDIVREAKAYAISKSSSRWTKKESIIESKLKLWKLYGQ